MRLLHICGRILCPGCEVLADRDPLAIAWYCAGQVLAKRFFR
jgi:hypothetical protein